ncbi:PH domain-containing protein [Nocardioides bigeumensis]|uniref:PH domain-containing protein n=1 Tax=Nocardioides bigeumensis TaxID=433657 RepID=A0ABN2YKW0_9ACTN
MTQPTPDEGWQRLDARMLLVHPVKVLRQFLVPAVIGIVGVRSSSGDWPLWMLPVAGVGAVLIGSLPWLTTRFRITDTQFQLHSGLVNKTQLTAPLDRIRSVDLESSLLHRLLGLAKVEIGTGVDDTRINLDALAAPQSQELRRVLLARRSAALAEDPADDAVRLQDVLADGHPETVLVRIDWAWLRFAPFSLSRLAVVAGAVGVLSQFGDSLPFLDQDSLESGWNWVVGFAIWLVVLVALVAGALAWTAISVAGYALQWWDFVLAREPGRRPGQLGNLRLTAGLFTTRSTTVEEARIRGVELDEPVLLRVVGGAELSTLATGVGESGVTKVLPPCPVEVATGVGGALLEDDAPLRLPLVPHGPAARRRCHVREQWGTLVFTAAAIAATAVLDLGWWLPVLVFALCAVTGALTAEAEYAHLGHAMTRGHLVAGSGSWTRTRTALEIEGVIGWVVQQNLFQRRAGLATLVATTAAGAEKVVVRDVPERLGVALANAATPGLLSPFLDQDR